MEKMFLDLETETIKHWKAVEALRNKAFADYLMEKSASTAQNYD